MKNDGFFSFELCLFLRKVTFFLRIVLILNTKY